jgi:hypothetical protein
MGKLMQDQGLKTAGTALQQQMECGVLNQGTAATAAAAGGAVLTRSIQTAVQ